MKLNRRQLVSAAAAGSALAVKAAAQQGSGAETDFAKAARELNQRNAETLAKVEVPFFTEPAFQFKA
jgi:hypothetical protein